MSPLRRAIHTASLGFGTALPYVCTELARERVSRHTCDQRRPLSEIKGDFPFVDFSEVMSEDDEMWLFKEIVPEEKSSEECAR